ncbi:MAG: Flp pilus assembly complex ATPase component TadA [Planctomycetes bacterium]|nr:Flp pilus assembly complex ATPase component TadA [Planctomycetota bacterium]MBL7007605.1 Flp pilus assembly complex ATPase component TadA [Planctomycetota bacterium]
MDTTRTVAGVEEKRWTVRLPLVLHQSREAEIQRLFASLTDNDRSFLDGSLVEAIDSEGLRQLVNGFDALRAAGYDLLLVDPSPTLRAARTILGIEQRLPIAGEAGAPEPAAPLSEDMLGDFLVQLGYLEPEKLEQARERAQARPEAFFGQVLVDEGWIQEDQLAIALARMHGQHFIKPIDLHILDVTLEHRVPLPELRTHGALPLLQFDDRLAVAVSDPADIFAVDGIKRRSGLKVLTCVTTPGEIQRGLDLLQRAGSGGASPIQEMIAARGTTVGELFDELLLNALIEGASDIHIEPHEDYFEVRYRVDGRLRKAAAFTPEEGRELTARIKVMAGCDISEKRLPQDGRHRFTQGSRDVDLRVNTLPTVYGEKTVMRILDRRQSKVSLERLGMLGQSAEWMREAVRAPHGMVLVTGPTGSGKTTTLYSVLDEIVTPEINVSTVENPVERAVEGVNQTQVNFKAGLDFGLCLRSLLRQDPDVIMIGEIRDTETAGIAVEAALTGHLVLATLHTNDAPGAATRLIQMGVEPFLVAATLQCVVAQRLARRLCDTCKQPVSHPEAVLDKYAAIGLSRGPHYAAGGCQSCRNSGYSGRLGLYEVMRLEPELREVIANNPSTDELRETALRRGMQGLLTDALRRVSSGATSLEEALRAGGLG